MGNSAISDERPAWTPERITKALGEPVAGLIATIAGQAHSENIPVFLAGGVVRDLVLERTILDLDFVLEGDAIAFADTLSRTFGGAVDRHVPFGTAKWKLDSAAINKLSVTSGEIPTQIDFASARIEKYVAPAALPVVEPGSILQDLQRRDFTVNALALRIIAGSRPWQVIDPYNGYSDINGKKLRVLHDRSFIDDPTRIFRATRFSSRFGFTIESGTEILLREAIPVIQRLSGERIRHELELILRETYPEQIVTDLRALNIFSTVHDSFRVSAQLSDRYKRSREHARITSGGADDMARLNWHLLFAGIAENDVVSICARLCLTQELSKSIAGFARLLSRVDWLGSAATKASQITYFLDGMSEVALRAGLIWTVDERAVAERIKSYLDDWRYRRSTIGGNELIRAGLEPGPIFRDILDRLRSGWIDGEIMSEDQERELYLKLVEEAKTT